MLYDRFADDWWKPTILLYAAQVKPARLLRQMIDQGATDLAYACWQDTTKSLGVELEEELKGLRQTVTASRYQQLQEYLKNGQWREADQETYRLMITTVGKEEGELFDHEDLLNFPCPDLRQLDELWVKYSNGKFGFSVQKEIWQECGSSKTRSKEWIDFCVKTGWSSSCESQGVIMMSRDNLKYDLSSSSAGELPFSGFWSYRELTGPYLFSRTETCEL